MYWHADAWAQRPRLVHRQINYFDYFSQWTPEELALYCFGCVAGAAAWAAALGAAACELRAARAAAADAIPLTAALLAADASAPRSSSSSLTNSRSSAVDIDNVTLLPGRQPSVTPRLLAGSHLTTACLPAALVHQ